MGPTPPSHRDVVGSDCPWSLGRTCPHRSLLASFQASPHCQRTTSHWSPQLILALPSLHHCSLVLLPSSTCQPHSAQSIQASLSGAESPDGLRPGAELWPPPQPRAHRRVGLSMQDCLAAPAQEPEPHAFTLPSHSLPFPSPHLPSTSCLDSSFCDSLPPPVPFRS